MGGDEAVVGEGGGADRLGEGDRVFGVEGVPIWDGFDGRGAAVGGGVGEDIGHGGFGVVEGEERRGEEEDGGGLEATPAFVGKLQRVVYHEVEEAALDGLGGGWRQGDECD